MEEFVAKTLYSSVVQTENILQKRKTAAKTGAGSFSLQTLQK